MDLFVTEISSLDLVSGISSPMSSHHEDSLNSAQNPALFTPQETPPNVDNTSEPSQPKKRGRKGHSKSRRGCFNCKKARIKCKENKPACDYCAHRDLICEWPDLQVKLQNETSSCLISGSAGQLARRNSDLVIHSPAALPVEIGPQGPVFTMLDFRLFNFFRDSAYPHHPVGNDKVWRNEIPCIASDYDFLLHSMLALAASELATTTDPTPLMHSTALTHRVKAISSLNTAISNGITCYEEGNAMIASCFSLFFQSCLLEDGLIEYMTFLRGTMSIGFNMGYRRMRFLFDKLFDNRQDDQIEPMMQAAPLMMPEVVMAANRSFERFEHLCVEKVEKDVFGILVGIARALITSSRDAYMNLRKMYELFSYKMSQPEFASYCNTSSVPCQLLQAHFVALQLVMAPVTKIELEFKERETGRQEGQNGQTVAWLVGIHKRVPQHLRLYFDWTMWVEKEVLNGNLYNGKARIEGAGGLNEVLEAWNTDQSFIVNEG